MQAKHWVNSLELQHHAETICCPYGPWLCKSSPRFSCADQLFQIQTPFFSKSQIHKLFFTPMTTIHLKSVHEVTVKNGLLTDIYIYMYIFDLSNVCRCQCCCVCSAGQHFTCCMSWVFCCVIVLCWLVSFKSLVRKLTFGANLWHLAKWKISLFTKRPNSNCWQTNILQSRGALDRAV